LQFGSYETYDDSLLGIKAFYSASLLARDEVKSRALAAAMTELQSIEDALPYEHQKRVRSHIPVGVYNVVADFGQARGANTATILPNDADHARKYGRIVLIRNNILANPAIFANSKQRFDAVVASAFRDHLTIDGSFNRTLWHEIGHYLGVSLTADGRNLAEALAEYADLVEEMKSDLVSLHAAPTLLEIGYYDEQGLRAHYADGIRRTLQVVRPRPEQPYQNMQLMQFNYFMEHGLIERRGDSALLAVDYERYHEVVSGTMELLGRSRSRPARRTDAGAGALPRYNGALRNPRKVRTENRCHGVTLHRVFQSHGICKGPPCARRHRRSGTERSAPPGADRHRGDQRQYRYRSLDGLRLQRLSARRNDGREFQHRKAQVDALPRCQGRADPGRTEGQRHAGQGC
jgi:hypothetical protein